MIEKMGGKVGEYGIGLIRKHLKENVEKKVIQRVKTRYDPFGKMNMNKVIEAGLSFELKQKPILPMSSPLKPVEKEESEELKPFIEEDSFEFIEEIKNPEDKMEAFIEKVELINRVEQNLDLKPEQDLSLQQAKDYEIKTRLKDYESTYESELKDENKKRIEDFAKNVAHDIIHPRPPITEIEKRVMDSQSRAKEEEFKINYPNERRGRLTKEEEDEIKRIMFGGSVKKEEKQNDNRI